MFFVKFVKIKFIHFLILNHLPLKHPHSHCPFSKEFIQCFSSRQQKKDQAKPVPKLFLFQTAADLSLLKIRERV